MAGQGELGARADLEVAEPARKSDLLLGRQFLVPEHQHRVSVVGVVDFFEDIVRQRLRNIDTADLGADAIAQWLDFHRVPCLPVLPVRPAVPLQFLAIIGRFQESYISWKRSA